MKKTFCIFVLLLSFVISCAAQDGQKITISGKVTDNHGSDELYQVVVVNERTSEGTLAAPGGLFTIQALHSDTILFTASGFMVKKVCLNDSAYKTNYSISVKLDSLHLSLAEVKVYPIKSLKEIDENKNRLGNKQSTDRYPDSHLLSSPISYLFERFNSMEQSKRKVAALEDDEQKRQVLKDLFHLYIKNDIIDLDDNHFDAFIDYLNFSDNFIKNSTDYELLMAIKYKYEAFENANSYYSPPAKH
ncbi:MAG TPA: hypothetical protein VK783_07840 [Bacteroidia bacterium]|nr:hypothetical protein [Bacteroidia bacterium]